MKLFLGFFPSYVLPGYIWLFVQYGIMHYHDERGSLFCLLKMGVLCPKLLLNVLAIGSKLWLWLFDYCLTACNKRFLACTTYAQKILPWMQACSWLLKRLSTTTKSLILLLNIVVKVLLLINSNDCPKKSIWSWQICNDTIIDICW